MGLILSSTNANIAYAFVVLASLFLVYRKLRISKKSRGPTAAASESLLDTDKTSTNFNRGRNSGEWTPVHFTYPSISPCMLELSEIQPIAHRPFQGGEHRVAMNVRPMPWDGWIEIDNQFENYHRIRSHRIRTRGHGAIRVLPETPGKVASGKDAAIELLHELAEYLSRRYPKVYHVERHTLTPPVAQGQGHGWEGAPPIRKVTVVPLGVTYDLPLTAPDVDTAEKALEIAALLIQEDLALMVEGKDGKFYFQAGIVCVPGFWHLPDKIGLSLEDIHLSGKVPQYESKLQKTLQRYFQTLGVGKPVTRDNLSFQVIKDGKLDPTAEDDIDPEELAWCVSTNGPEDEAHGRHMDLSTGPTPTPSNLRMRTERETVRRLPRSGAILFTIRTYLTPVEQLGREPGIPGKLASSLRGWGTDVGIYKGKERGSWWNVLVGYLDSCHEEQIRNGVSEESNE